MTGYRERAAFYAVENLDTIDQPFLSELALEAGGPVLEVPCGSGRNLGLLAASGRRVTGVDREPGMVRVARAAAEHAPGVEVRLGDMRSFTLGEPAALVLVPREAFQLLPTYADAAAALRCFSGQLRADGTVMLDLATFAAGEQREQHLHPSYFHPQVPDGRVVSDWVRPAGDGQLARWHWQRRRRDAVTVGYRYELRRTGAAARAWEAAIRLLRYSPERIIALLAQAGLRPHALLGDYERRPYRPGSPRLVVLAGRGEA